jgi:hypothetical protein
MVIAFQLSPLRSLPLGGVRVAFSILPLAPEREVFSIRERMLDNASARPGLGAPRHGSAL